MSSPAMPRRIGVVLLNLGTPDATDYRSMRRYLSEFLSDQRVIDYPAWAWQPLLQLVILSRRPSAKGKEYDSIWNRERNESPLKTVTREQAEKVAASLADRPEVIVDWAMRYGNPSTDLVIRRLTEQGCDRILLMALYPQYAAPTTATAYDKAFDTLKQLRFQPALRTVGSWHDDPRYIGLLADSVRNHLATQDFEPERLLISFHGMPERFSRLGDPYERQCRRSGRLLQEALGWPEERVTTCFQSRFGPEEWLKPYFDVTLGELPGQGIKKIAVISPAFVTDCLETLEEIAVAGQETFLHAGGERFTYVPCLNAADPHIGFLTALIRRELGGWIEQPHPSAVG